CSLKNDKTTGFMDCKQHMDSSHSSLEMTPLPATSTTKTRESRVHFVPANTHLLPFVIAALIIWAAIFFPLKAWHIVD
ncbi:hypothetical protein J6590_081258, partial [Homalodisca vitripennis]